MPAVSSIIAVWCSTRSNQRLAWLFLDELDDDAAAFSEALAVCRDGSCEDVVTRPPNRNRTAVNE